MQETWSEEKTSIQKNVHINFIRTQSNDRPTIILAHGITDMGLCWQPFAADLEADYDILMYDAYGHGRSSRIDPDSRFDLAADLHDLINTLKLEKPGIIGHSMGAATAAEFASRYPDMLSALVLEDPPWSDEKIKPEQIEATRQTWKQRIEDEKEKTVKELVKLKKKEAPNWDERILETWAQAKHAFDPAFLDHYSFKPIDWRAQVKNITAPTLLVTGDTEHGALVDLKTGVEAVKLLDKGEFGHISNAGHCVRYEHYAPYLAMVKLFLKRNMPV